MSLESSGADYLRRLRADEERPSEGPPSDPVPPQLAQDGSERRQHPRYKCEGSAQFLVTGSDVRTWGTFTDLSMNGCYVEMTATFPRGAIVDLNLELNGLQVHTKGEVRVSYPFLGIGIAFRDMTDENRVRLQQMVRTLLPASRGVRVVANEIRAESESPAVVVNPAAAIQSVMEFFELHSVMSKEQFLHTIRKSQTMLR